ncbi:SDR family NAD(P)-dependent oxidoreductase [Evansella sp. AB-P1]|uniref:SDR family NAD(P)-dependent oxidoreductase n=1 Tax=Evansella sp. AB-P1 TaxID=3037653 RepID=UPI00241D7C2B|nr:SDR family NAD(P)-dependent oxidoreductase [Evansella sp. AB-P1]MDG5788901.1 SDR family NAD(P)-dependent oxidoreductase [Evansella sp. AB-P1]
MQSYRFVESCLFLPSYLNRKKLVNYVAGKSILITGASSGIGEQLTYQLADIHCHLILVARRGEKLSKIKNDLAMKAAKVSIYQGDLRNEEEREALLSFLHELPNGLDIVVSNAGLSIRRSIFESLDRYHDFTRTVGINYFAPVHLLLSIIPLLQKNQGHIINISTVNVLLAPVPYFAAYQASKSAFDVWLRSVSPELKAKGIATTTLYLPLVKTPMIQPTKEYRYMPAMSANHVAKIICKTMYTKKKKYQPWWLIFGQIPSIFVRNFGNLSNKGGK